MADVFSVDGAETRRGISTVFYDNKNWTFCVTLDNKIRIFMYTNPEKNPQSQLVQVKSDRYYDLDAGKGAIAVTKLTKHGDQLRLYIINKGGDLKEYCLDSPEGEWVAGSLNILDVKVGEGSDLAATPDPIKVIFKTPNKPGVLSMAWKLDAADRWEVKEMDRYTTDK